MKTTVEIGKTYALRSEAGGEVTDVDGKTLETLEPNKQVHMTAQESEWVVPDDCKVTKANFKQAALALGLLGGGKNDLPAGYTPLAWLSSTQDRKQTIDTGVVPTASTGLYVEYTGLSGNSVLSCQSSPSSTMFGFVNGGYRWNAIKDYTHEHTNVVAELNMNGDHTFKQLRPSVVTVELPELNFTPRYPLGMFSQYYAGKLGDEPFYGRISRAKIFDGKNKIRDFVPALDPDGTPCMFDLVSKQPFKNAGSGQFIAGCSLAQARRLGKLPAGTTLTVSLPVGYGSDAGVVAALAAAEANGCVLPIQTYAAEAAVATFALRRIWVKRTQDENGSYVAADGSRWQVDWWVDVIGADPEGLGYERFRSVEAAVAYWELEPYEVPEEIAD